MSVAGAPVLVIINFCHSPLTHINTRLSQSHWTDMTLVWLWSPPQSCSRVIRLHCVPIHLLSKTKLLTGRWDQDDDETKYAACLQTSWNLVVHQFFSLLQILDFCFRFIKMTSPRVNLLLILGTLSLYASSLLMVCPQSSWNLNILTFLSQVTQNAMQRHTIGACWIYNTLKRDFLYFIHWILAFKLSCSYRQDLANLIAMYRDTHSSVCLWLQLCWAWSIEYCWPHYVTCTLRFGSNFWSFWNF